MTIRLLADENIDPDLVLGVRRRVDHVDFVRVQDVGLRTADDPTILQWAADHGRILVTHDADTIPASAHERVMSQLAMPGVFLIRSSLPMGTSIDDLALIAEATDMGEWANRVVYLPLR